MAGKLPDVPKLSRPVEHQAREARESADRISAPFVEHSFLHTGEQGPFRHLNLTLAVTVWQQVGAAGAGRVLGVPEDGCYGRLSSSWWSHSAGLWDLRTLGMPYFASVSTSSSTHQSRGRLPTTLAQLDPPSKMSYILRDLPPAIIQIDTETIRATKGTSELITRPSIVSIGIHQIRYTLTLFDLDDTGVLCYSQS